MIACLDNFTPPALPDNLSLLSMIGHGGAGNVYLVQDITGKKLALKIIRPDWQTKEFNAITSLRELSPHPALIQVYQTGKLSSGEFYYTMELADNICRDASSYRPDTLAARIADLSMSLDEILQLFIILAGGIQHLHDAQIYHGDIKPENIIFVNGKPKIADYGTLGSGTAGTAGFIPENPLSGIDRDCYALCKTFYCTWSKLDAADYPIPPEKYNSHELTLAGRIYISGCSPVASQRFADAQALLAALQTTHHKLFAPAGRQRWWRIPAAVVILLSLAAVLYTLNSAATKEQPRIEVQMQRDKDTLYLAELFVKNSDTVTGNFNGLRSDFRNIFEEVDRAFPEELDPDFRKNVRNFYRECDFFIKLRKQLLSENLSDKEFLRLYREEKYKERFLNLNTRQSEFYTQGNDKHIQKVLKVYFGKVKKSSAK